MLCLWLFSNGKISEAEVARPANNFIAAYVPKAKWLIKALSFWDISKRSFLAWPFIFSGSGWIQKRSLENKIQA